jgi:hypothetical protein
MGEDETLEMLKEVPEINPFSVNMSDTNEQIEIYEGEFILKNDSIEIKIVGNVAFDWFPNSGANFNGIAIVNPDELIKILYELNSFRLLIDGFEVGQGFITKTNFSSSQKDIFIKGTLAQQVVLGDRSISVNKIHFSIPNLREFHGLPVKSITGRNSSLLMNRLHLEDDNYVITIDKCRDYKERKDLLKEKGGYIILYAGELTSKKGSLSHANTKEVFHCLATYLSFLNGRRTSALFIKGIHDDQIVWSDYTNYFVDTYKAVHGWPQRNSIIGLNDLWKKFNSFWKDTDDKDFLTSVIHWYVEANGHAGFSEGSIILAQTALELIYNWWIIEQKGMILGKDTENISASNKIRLILSQLNIDYKTPIGLTHLKAFQDSMVNIADAPEAIVYIRNAIVHSQEEKRKKLSQIHYRAKFEALQLCIWYIEMSLLYILNYDNQYYNRCSNATSAIKAEVFVPWSSKL